MGAVDTTYTFTATDTITSSKMNNIIDQTTITPDAIIGTTLDVASGKLKVRSAGITSNEIGANSVTTNAITDLNITTGKIADLSVTTGKIADLGVTTAKIADSNVTTIKIADANITAEKLNGAQSGSAPIFGVRAWVNFNGVTTVSIREKGNVSTVVRDSGGIYTITFATPMPDTNYSILGWARVNDATPANGAVVSAGSTYTKTTTQCQVRVSLSTVSADSPEVNIIIMR